MACRCVFRLIKWAIVIAAAILLINYWLANKSYVFTQASIEKIALNHIGGDARSSFVKIHRDLRSKYPGHILPADDLQWVFITAGGWMGSVCLLHASVTEYVLFFGTAMETRGHSGRFWANITDIVLTGEIVQWKEGEMSLTTSKPGSVLTHVWGDVAAVNFKQGTWVVEYARGFVPSTLTFGLADTIFSTQDLASLFYLMKVYSKALLLEISTWMVNMSGG